MLLCIVIYLINFTKFTEDLSKMKVAKFGGSSVANASQIKKVVDIVLSDKDRRIVVVSAPGKRLKEDTKVTDLLITLAETIIAGKDGKLELKIIIERFKNIIDELSLSHELLEEIQNDILKRIAEDKSLPTGIPCDVVKYFLSILDLLVKAI